MIFPVPSLSFKKHKKIFIYFFLIAIACMVYQNIYQYDFLNFDDNAYVTDNSRIHQGLSFQNIAWAFGFSEESLEFYWHPLTWISHIADCQLFGLDAGMHHLTNVFIHMINVMLLFTVCFRMTGGLWQSFFVAAVFAVHPVNVESVAWISERKNVLSTLFWMLAMAAYLYYAKRPGIRRYLVVMIPFISGLLAKPMLVTLPCVFLLLDFWPLQRLTASTATGQGQTASPSFAPAPARKLVGEKLPLLLISFLSIAISLFSAHLGQQIISAKNIPLSLRLENALVSYVRYIGKLLWPRDMAVFYPFPEAVPIWQVIGAVIFLAFISGLCIVFIKKAPYLMVGWLWYLGTLFPVIGISQHGRWPEMADRWLYVPEIGLLIIIAWGGTALLSKFRHPGRIIIPLVLVIFATLIFTARAQLAHWQNSKTLFEHALNVTENNHIAHFNLGLMLAETGQVEKAMIHYQKALRLDPQEPKIHINLGNALARKGRFNEAILQLESAVAINSNDAKAHYNLGAAFESAGQTDKAKAHYLNAIKIQPNHAEAHNNLAALYLNQNQLEKAIIHFKEALAITPENAQIHYNLAIAFYKNKNIDAAILSLQNALKINPDYHQARLVLEKIRRSLPENQQR